jgi:acyl-CoA thioester hydrolase
VALFRHRIRVRYNECDQQNAVFNSNYLIYCDVTITELWRDAFGSYEAMAKDGVDLVVAEANVRYLKPARFDDELDVSAEIERLGNTAMTTRFDIDREGELVVQARIRHVFVALEHGEKTPIPDHIRETLERYVAPEATA